MTRLTLLLILATATAMTAAPLTLVRDRVPTVEIVVADDAGPVAREAAASLQSYLERIGGSPPSIRSESSSRPDGLRTIFVGHTRAARAAGIDPEGIEREGFTIRARGDRIFIVGADRSGRDRGTRHGVSSFLEKELGVRWLWPGELGTVIPRADNVTVSVTDRTEMPFMHIRTIRDAMHNRSPRKLLKGMEILGMTEETRAGMGKHSREWCTQMRLGGDVLARYGHAFSHWWEDYHEEHPEYFAMMPDGVRGLPYPTAERVKICVSNPAVQEQWLANAREYFKANPDSISVSASPNDNVYQGHCLCPRCESWDAPGGEIYEMRWMVDGREITREHVSLSDRYVRFYNVVAERLVKEYPDRFVGAYAYGTWLNPPVRERKIHPNVLMGYVSPGNLTISDEVWTVDRENWDGWAAVAENLFFRPNMLWGGHGMPLIYVHRLAEDIRHRADTGMMGADFDSLLHRWGNQGLNYYVLAKLLWDPHLDVDALLDDYVRAAFGPAASAMKDYYAALEEHTMALQRDMPEVSNHTNDVMPLIPRFWPVDVIDGWRGMLQQALERVPAGSEHARRIEWVESGLDYATLQSRLLGLTTREVRTPEHHRRIARASAELEEWYLAHLTDWSAFPPLLRYREPAALYGRSE